MQIYANKTHNGIIKIKSSSLKRTPITVLGEAINCIVYNYSLP